MCLKRGRKTQNERRISSRRDLAQANPRWEKWEKCPFELINGEKTDYYSREYTENTRLFNWQINKPSASGKNTEVNKARK